MVAGSQSLVLEALKAKAPALHADLAKSGKLAEFLAETADEISSQVVSMTQAQRIKEKWDSLGSMECAARIVQADAMNREIVLAQMLEFPQDTTEEDEFPDSPDGEYLRLLAKTSR